MIARTRSLLFHPAKATAIVLAAAGFLSASSLAAAKPANADDGVPRAVVRYGDLNLNTEEGAVRLYWRIAKAAEQVCPYSDGRNLSARVISERCIKEAIARAVAEVNSPQLARIEANGGRRTRQG